VGKRAELRLPPRLHAIAEEDYPRFSAAEMARRRGAVARAMAEAGVDHLLVHGGFFRSGPVHWLSGWMPTWEAVLVFTPGERDSIFVQFFNHMPQAKQLMPGADMRWGGPSSIASAIAELKRRGAKARRVGIMGGTPVGHYRALVDAFETVPDLNGAYARLRIVKSGEEIDRARVGARMTDLAIEALVRELRPGLTERDLGAIAESAFVPWGATSVIHFFGVTAMADPDTCVPRQYPADRQIQAGDVVTCEISADFWGYGGQILRTFTVGADFTPRYRDLHTAADAAFDAVYAVLRPGCHAQEIVDAAHAIEDAGFTTCDDLMHGYNGGYFPPVLGSPSRQNEPVPDMRLEAGMMVVVQPNVITRDERAGVQLGECLLITDTGAETIHTAPRGPLHVG
jgi:Xaa-Pro aminopeptidase